MNRTRLVDATGVDMNVGDLVCYTTNSRGSGLQFGTIFKVYEDEVQRWHYDPVLGTRELYDDVSYRLSVTYTEPDGGPIYEQEYDGITRTWSTTSIVSTKRSGVIEYHASKFLKL